MLDQSETIVPELFHLGPKKNVAPFTHEDVATISSGLATVFPFQTKSYLLLSLPVSIPIFYGDDLTVHGPINKGHIDCFEHNLPGSS